MLLHSALERIAPRVVSFEEPCTIIREGLAEVLEKQEDYSKAAQVLAGIDMDSGTLLLVCVTGPSAPLISALHFEAGVIQPASQPASQQWVLSNVIVGRGHHQSEMQGGTRNTRCTLRSVCGVILVPLLAVWGHLMQGGWESGDMNRIVIVIVCGCRRHARAGLQLQAVPLRQDRHVVLGG
jgi:hypothetical protein